MTTRGSKSLASRMDINRWERAKSILADALEQESPDARNIFVRKACSDDTALRRDIELLLTHDSSESGAFDDCAAKVARSLDGAAPLSRGARIGQYLVLRELGRGGMGAVYLGARADGEFTKHVAIKVLKRGTDTDETLRRFRAERQILAQLDHANIAHLLDGGTTADGLPYFVMDYVDGVPIGDFARAKNLSIEARLALFLKVCRAVEFAHENRVIHRDLKPNNILVDKKGEPKLLDFGIAKLLAEGQSADVTSTDQRRLTPSCASPEQARGETVTPISDVYALGALLYELLTDKSPHQFQSRTPSAHEVARVVCEEEPIAPSLTSSNGATRRRLRGDLDQIVLYALRKEAARRYQSVAQLAADLRRHLQGERLHARPNTISYHTRRFVRHHQRLFGVAIIFLLATVILLQRPRYRRASVSPIPEKSIAVLPFQNIGQTRPDDYFVEGVQDNITTDLAHIGDLKVISRSSVSSYRNARRDPQEIGAALGVAHLLEGTVQRSENRLRVNARLIDTRTGAESWAEHFDRDAKDLFTIQNEVARQIVARLRASLSPSEKAALELQPTKDFHAYELYLRARSLIYQFSVGLTFQKNAHEAISLLEQAIARDPDFMLAHCLLAETHLYLYRYVGRIENESEQLALARAEAQRAFEIAPDAPEPHLTRGRLAYFGARDYPTAFHELRVALPGLPNDAGAWGMLALTERRSGRWSEAIRDHEKAIALDPHSTPQLLALAESYHALRHFSRAEEILDRAISAMPPKDADVFSWAKGLAVLGRGDVGAARAALEGPTGSLADTRVRLAQLCIMAGDYAAAERLADERLAIDGKDHRAFVVKAQIAASRHRPEEALAYYDKALALFPPAYRKQPDSAQLYAWHGPLLAIVGRREEALAAALHATELVPTSKDLIDGPVYEAALAQTHAILGDLDNAFAILERLAPLPCAPLVGELEHDPMWQNLRRDPRFSPLIAQLRAPIPY